MKDTSNLNTGSGVSLGQTPAGGRLVVASAPLRVSFNGGGTDVMPYSARYGGVVVSAAINRYMHASIRTSRDRQGAGADERFALAHRLLDYRMDASCEYRMQPSQLSGSGLGTSSAAVVAVVAAVAKWHGTWLSAGALARLAYRLEREELGHPGGAQDHYSAAYGGVNFMEFSGGGEASVSPLVLAAGVLRRLEESMILCDIGVRRDRARGVQAGPELRESRTAMENMKSYAGEMRDRLLAGDLAQFARLVQLCWLEKQRIVGGQLDPRAWKLLRAGDAAGAAAGRMLGAIGGGFLLFLVSPERRAAVCRALNHAGGRIYPIAISWKGAADGLASPT